jgi:hypothetical protein
MDITMKNVTSFLEENENITVLVVSVIYLVSLGYSESVHAIWSFALLFIIFFYAFNIPLSMAGLFAVLGSLIVQVSSYPGLMQMKPTSRYEPFTPAVTSEEHSAVAVPSMTDIPSTSMSSPTAPSTSMSSPTVSTKVPLTTPPTTAPPSSPTPVVDVNKTIMSSISSLTPTQIESMTSDTKELIQTQKSLLETVKQLAPVVSQGREMLETFKGYFGNTNDLVSMLKSDSSLTK